MGHTYSLDFPAVFYIITVSSWTFVGIGNWRHSASIPPLVDGSNWWEESLMSAQDLPPYGSFLFIAVMYHLYLIFTSKLLGEVIYHVRL